MNKHTASDLKQMQSLPLPAKILMTKRRIREWYEHWNGQVYVSFSGGKDSTVLKHIVDQMYSDVPALFVNTGLEYPEIQQFAKSHKNVVTVRPEMRFDEVIKKYGYPVVSKIVSKRVEEAKSAFKKGNFDAVCVQQIEGRYLTPDGKKSPFNYAKWSFLMDAPFDVSHKCCNVMKKRPAKRYEKETERKPILGTMASESRLRYTSWLKNGCNAFDSENPKSQPMSFWTEQDVLQYIKKYNVPYCSVYGDIVPVEEAEQIEGQMNVFEVLNDYELTSLMTTGCTRTGCIFCMFGCHLEKEPNRFQRLKETHPRQYDYCINGGEMSEGKWQPSSDGLGIGKVLEYINVNY